MQKPAAIASRGVRKDTLEQVCKDCSGNLARICEFLHCDKEMATALLMAHGLYPMTRSNGAIGFTEQGEWLFQLAKEEAGYKNRQLPKLDDCFLVRWSPEAWGKIVECAEIILEKNGSIYDPRG